MRLRNLAALGALALVAATPIPSQEAVKQPIAMRTRMRGGRLSTPARRATDRGDAKRVRAFEAVGSRGMAHDGRSRRGARDTPRERRGADRGA